MNALLGGQAKLDKGKFVGISSRFKKSSLSNSRIVARSDGFNLSILLTKFLAEQETLEFFG
jgi:hypothetical protein